MSHPNEPIIQVKKYIDEDLSLKRQFHDRGQKPPQWLKDQHNDDIEFMKTLRRNPTLIRNFGMTSFSACFKKTIGAPGFWIWNDFKSKNFPHSMFLGIPVTGNTTWSSPLNLVKLRGGRHNVDWPLACKSGKCNALFDSGTSLLAGPSAIVDKLLKKLNEIGFDCTHLDKMPNLVLFVHGKKLILPADEYIGILEGEPLAAHQQYFPQT